MRVKLDKEFFVPDKLKIARYKKAPELGPKILFFSGGSALRELSKILIHHTHNSIHIITPFDSGGSSAVLRQAFHMPAVGDIRNRLMSLADQSIKGNKEIFELFRYRLCPKAEQKDLQQELTDMSRGRHERVTSIPVPRSTFIRRHLSIFEQSMPIGFDLHGASIGNLILTAGYLEYNYQLDPVIFIYSKLAEVRGVVKPVVNKDFHLGARLENGDLVIGQHLLTGKESPSLNSKIEDIYLTESLQSQRPVETRIPAHVEQSIVDAELICFPMGSFYTSLIANLLPTGVGQAVAKAKSPKIFIPNTGHDPECFGQNLNDQIKTLINRLAHDLGPDNSLREVLDFVLLDADDIRYKEEIDPSLPKKYAFQIVTYPLITSKTNPYLDAERLSEVLLSLT